MKATEANAYKILQEYMQKRTHWRDADEKKMNQSVLAFSMDQTELKF